LFKNIKIYGNYLERYIVESMGYQIPDIQLKVVRERCK